MERGDEIWVCPWGWLYPSLNETALSYDTTTERERQSQREREETQWPVGRSVIHLGC